MNSIFKKTLILSGGLFLFLFLSAKPSLAVNCNPYPPLGGLYTITTTPSCSFVGTPNGADNGGITISTGVNLIIPASSTVTWSSGQSVTIQGTGSISINATNSQLSKTNLWMVDADADGWPVNSTQTAAATSPGGTYARRNTLNSGSFNTSTGAWTLDCNDAAYSLTNSCCVPTTWYRDADSDTYGNASVTTSSCTQPAGYVANSTDCNDADATKWQNLTGYVDADGDTYTTGGGVQVCSGASLPSGYRAAANGADCNDADATKWQNLTGYTDGDGDGYGINGTSVCSGASLPAPYIATGGDCYDSNAAAHPGQTAYYTTNRGDGSFDYNCSGVNEVSPDPNNQQIQPCFDSGVTHTIAPWYYYNSGCQGYYSAGGTEEAYTPYRTASNALCGTIQSYPQTAMCTPDYPGPFSLYSTITCDLGSIFYHYYTNQGGANIKCH